MQIQRECKLDINVDEYVESTARPYLMDVIYCWSKVGLFFHVCTYVHGCLHNLINQ